MSGTGSKAGFGSSWERSWGSQAALQSPPWATEAVMAEAAQVASRPARPRGVPAGGGRLGREPAPGSEDDQMEGVGRAGAVGGGVGEGPDDLELLDDRARPAVGDDERQGVGVVGADVEEVDVQAVDLGQELGQRVQLGLDLAPVVGGRPVAGEARMVARGTPWESSSTVSRSGHLVASIRRRSPARSSSGKLTRNGRIAAGRASPRRGADQKFSSLSLPVPSVDAADRVEGLLGRGGGRGDPRHPHRGDYRSDRNAARISSANSSGSSQAAKWPPWSTSLK